jgi:hypothetical protein
MMADKIEFSVGVKQLEKLETVADWLAPAAGKLGLTQFVAPGDFAAEFNGSVVRLASVPRQ